MDSSRHPSRQSAPRRAVVLLVAAAGLAATSFLSKPTANATTQGDSSNFLELREPAFIGQRSTLGFFSVDATLAVGVRHFIVVRNSAITLFVKPDGGAPARQLSEASLSSFLAPASHPDDRLSDPIALYDPDAGRFFIGNAAFNTCTAADTCDGGMQIAVSKTATPETLTAADWHFYRLDRGVRRVNGGTVRVMTHGDFDKLAVIGGVLLVSWQEAVTTPSGTAVSSLVRVLDKQALLDGRTPDTWRDFVHDGNTRARLATVHESRDRAADRAFLDIRARCGNEGLTWTIGAMVDLGTTPRLETRDVVVATPCSGNSTNPAPQAGTARQIFVQHLNAQPAYRDGRLWVFETNGRDARDATAEIAWAELDVRDWPSVRVLQSGRISGGASHAYAPSAALDSAGNLAVIYTQSGSGEFASIYYTGRLATDPPNTMRASRLLKAGTRPFDWPEFTNPVMSFVDYPTMTIDPVDGSFWMTGLLPTESAPAPGRAELSDAWVARLRPAASDRAREQYPR
jgi:hypothetical protein